MANKKQQLNTPDLSSASPNQSSTQAAGRSVKTIPQQRNRNLRDLLAECDLSALHSSDPDIDLWDNAKPVGREVW